MVRRTRFVLNLAFSHFHKEWLPCSVGKEAFRQACAGAGVSKIGILRHGKTAPKPEGALDFDRLLTEQGREQAREAGASFGKDLLPFHPTMLVSPAPRTVETAELFLQAAGASSRVKILPISGLYDGSMQPEGSKLFQEIGYAPLRDYVENADIKNRDTARRVFGEYSSIALEAVTGTLMEMPEGGNNNLTLWLVSHAIYLSSVALGVASLVDCKEEGLETILSSNTKEAEGFLIDIENAEARYLSRPSTEN